ncbi:sigma-70 family RNA polymerase sigma factor [Paludisphaera rhizosphaerae]|uniref:sigma-70 family RNA polymerase sigma factor n=1 Tax=Paludisphaera rhizosphaerae TaxID=2711216 RepID=UPI0013E9FAB6|nr:sigma-70 family RNA polymerase sigma factor [Paludisphaera rhizosphaerae]
MNATTLPCPPSADHRRSAPAFSGRSNPWKTSNATEKGRSAPAYPDKCRPRSTRPPLSQSQRDLAERYVPLARSQAKKFAKSCPWAYDDFRASASLALVEAAQTFDPDRGIDFATYARHRIHGALVDAQRELFSDGWRGAKELRPRFRPLDSDENRGTFIGQHAEEPVGASLEARDDVDHWLRKLPPRHAEAFRHIYLDGKTQEETADLVGCSKAGMCRLHRELLDRIRDLEGGRPPLLMAV